jgi:hypothetical protein
MKRREFIKSGLVMTAVAGATGPSAFGEVFIPTEEHLTQTEMERFIREMDASMDRIAHSGGDYLKSLTHQTPRESEQKFFRSSLRSLMLIGSFGELPIKGQVHPWMQKRMMYSAPEVDFSVLNSFDILKNLSGESMEEIRSALTDDPELGGRILDTLDLEARSIGVPSARRRQMKVMGKRIIRRLRHSPEMLIDEYVKKTEKLLLASNSEEAFERLFKMQVGEAKYTDYSKEAERAALQWKISNIPDLPVGYGLLINDQPPEDGENDKPPLKGLRLLGIGGIVLGTGWLLMVAFGSIDTFVGFVGVVLGVTIGPLLILIALITILISAIIRSRNSKKTSQ